MKLKVITLRFDPETGGFDDAALLVFQQGRQILHVHEHFFTHNELPMWALLVSYREEDRPGERAAERDKGKDWRAELSPSDRVLYDALRTWRNDRATRDGRPPYILLTNRQMAEIAKKRPRNIAPGDIAQYTCSVSVACRTNPRGLKTAATMPAGKPCRAEASRLFSLSGRQPEGLVPWASLPRGSPRGDWGG